jgi:hypothetical protein
VLKGGKRLVHPDKDILGNLFRIFFSVDKARDGAEYLQLVLLHQAFKGSMVARCNFLYQLFVRHSVLFAVHWYVRQQKNLFPTVKV